MHQLKALTLAVIGMLIGASTAGAQDPLQPQDIVGWSIVPALQLAGIYERNVLFTAAPQTDGSYLTLGPSLEARHRGPVGTFNAGYSFNSELHTGDLHVLNDMFARQIGSIAFESKTSTRSTVSGSARYLSSRRPEDVLDPTGLAATNRRTTSFRSDLGIDHSVTPKTRVRFNYAVSFDDYGKVTELRPGARNTLHSMVVGPSKTVSPRTTLGVEVGGKYLIGEEFRPIQTVHGSFWSGVVAMRWTQALTPRVTATVLAGPRAAQVVPPVIASIATTPVKWELKPEVLASLAFRGTTRVLSIAYTDTQYLGVGASGFIDTRSVELTAGAKVGRRLRLSTRPGFYFNSLAGLGARSYRVDGTVGFQATSWASIDAIYMYRHQDQSLALTDYAVTAAALAKTRNRLVVGMTIRRATQM